MGLFSKWLFLILFTTFFSTAKGQKLTRAEFDSIIKSAHPSYHPDSSLYVVNGVPFEPEVVDLGWTVMPVDITYLSNYKHEASHQIWVFNVVLITRPYSQKNKTKKKELTLTRHLFLPPGNTNPVLSPVLFIDDVRIEDADAFNAVKKLKSRKLYFIHYSKPVQTT